MIWLDAHLSPRIAKYISEELGHEAIPLRDVGLHHAEDAEIYQAARKEGVIFITKDQDFVDLSTRLGPPPHIIWLTCGNTSEKRLKEIFSQHLATAITLILSQGETLVEISGS